MFALLFLLASAVPERIYAQFTVAEGSTYNGAVENGDAPFTLIQGPSYGTLTFNSDGSFTYTAHRQPTAGFQDTDSFEYKSNDQEESDDPYVVSITITPVNDAPVAQSKSFTVDLGDTHSGQVTATDVDGDALTYALQTGPDNGTLVFNTNGSFSYTANSYGDGTDSFTFVANDGWANSEPATVSINISSAFCGGSGTEAEPYLICTADELNNVRLYLDAYFKLDDDIDLNAAPYNDGEGWEPIGTSSDPFIGSFDGDEFTISNLFINRPEENTIGLFGAAGSSAEFKNIKLNNVWVNGSWNVGGLIGAVSGSIVNNTYVTGEITGSSWRVGGMFGRINTDSNIKNSHTNVTVNSTGSYVGGLAGFNDGLIENSYSSGEVNIIVPSTMPGDLGGLVGYNQNNGVIINSYSDAIVFGTSHLVNRVGGLVGNNWGTIDDSHSTGNVNGRSSIGGFVGNNRGTILNSYSTGDALGSNVSVGGFAGRNDDATIRNSYSTGSAESTYSDFHAARVGGFIGYNSGSTIVENSSSTGNATGRSNIGGFIGENSEATVKNSFSTGNVFGGNNLGGFVGATSRSSEIQRSFSTGDVDHRDGGYGRRIGGFVGSSEDNSTMIDSYAMGDVRGRSLVGGFAGRTQDDTQITNSFSAVFVDASGDNVAGFIGSREDDTLITNAFFDSEVSNQTDGVGEGATDGVYARSSIEMKQLDTFSDDWDIALTDTELNDGYPFLAWQDGSDDSVWLITESPLFCGGEGTEDDPYLICTADELNNVREDLSAYYKLDNDIDLEAYLADDGAGYNDGKGWEPIGTYVSWDNADNVPFTGSLDGDGHAINNLFINVTDHYYAALFELSDGAVFKNMSLNDVNITGNGFASALISLAFDTEISEVISSGQINAGTRGGGLIGESFDSIISNSGSSCDVTVDGNTNAGGLAATINNTDVRYSFASGTVNGSDDMVGGLIGEAVNNSVIYKSYATGDVVAGDHEAGGLVGFLGSGSEIVNSYATGSVEGGSNSNAVGGLVGSLSSAKIMNSNSSGPVTGSGSIGGLVGAAAGTEDPEISESYATGNVTGSGNNVGGLIGRNRGAEISNSFAAGVVNGGGSVGGLVGDMFSNASIKSSYSTGDVHGNSYIGGLVGNNHNSSIHNSYAVGGVNGKSRVGGLVGLNSSGTEVFNSYSVGTVSGTEHVGGLLGGNSGTVTNSFYDRNTSGQEDDDGRGTPKSTSEMKRITTFTNTATEGLDESWDFTNLWAIESGDYISYPYFGNSDEAPEQDPPPGLVRVAGFDEAPRLFATAGKETPVTTQHILFEGGESVTITQLPVQGTLLLDGTAVENNDVIHKGDVEAGKLGYIPEKGIPATVYVYGYDQFIYENAEEQRTLPADLAAQAMPYEFTEGWFLFSSPGVDQTVGELLGNIRTEGYPGSTNPGASFPTVYTLDQ
ncbi:MAG: hypothetical protein EA391_12060, partial [Balneolaceae bacterium]